MDKYNIYYTDEGLFCNNKNTFTLLELRDWLISFAEPKRFMKNELDMDIPNPDTNDKPFRIFCKNGIRFYAIHKIENRDGIIFSDGEYTGGQKYWNDEAKDICHMLLENKECPVYNFV